MKTRYLFCLALAAVSLSSCGDFLDRAPEDQVTDQPSFWESENNIRASVLDLYTDYFPGFRSGWSRADQFAETRVADWTDDNAQQAATMFENAAPTTADGANIANPASPWDFTNVTTINKLIAKIEATSLSDEAKNHWLGVARFLRAMDYSRAVKRFGDVPWFDKAPGSTDYDELYKERTPRATVMDNVLADLEFASKNVRQSDGVAGLYINKDVVDAFASSIMLFEGTWQKYREQNTQAAAKYLQASKTFADNVISSGRYSLCDNYKSLTNSEDLDGNPEIILYRSYVSTIVTHSLPAFQWTQHEKSSPSKSLVDSYLSANGLPIGQADNAQKLSGEEDFKTVIAKRDPRLYAAIDTTGLQLNGVADVWAISGYFSRLFVTDDPARQGTADWVSSTCVSDAPVMRYDEVLLNDIEACAELASMGQYSLSQADFDRTINVLRDRKSVSMPHVTLQGENLAVGGKVINDPKRDASVSAILWEIRRERRTELVYSGNRYNDLRRWGKLDYADMVKNPDINLGAWIDKDQYVAQYNAAHPGKPISVATLASVHLDRAGNAGYIQAIQDRALLRQASERDYLYPLPVNEITLYKEHGKTLKQNPGWE